MDETLIPPHHVSNPMETKYCVRCLDKKATIWTGHVIRDGKRIKAGWCSYCNSSVAAYGFVGHYKKRMKCRKKS